MNTKIRKALVLTCSATAVVLAGPTTAAFADHCTDEGPGHSYFGTEHVQEAEHDEGTSHRGFSDCDPDGRSNGNDRQRP